MENKHIDITPAMVLPISPTISKSELNDLLSSCSPFPWRIDKDNSEGIEVVDAVGNLVFVEDYGCFPDEMSSSQRDQITVNIRANARLMVIMSGGR